MMQLKLSFSLVFIWIGICSAHVGIPPIITRGSLPSKLDHAPSSGTLVAFSVGRSRPLTAGQKSVIIDYDKIILDVGGGYKNDTGVFEAPVDGVYVFNFHTFNGLVDVFTSTGQYLVSLNGGVPFWYVTSGSNQVIVRLKKGESIWASLRAGSSLSCDSQMVYVTFSGFLLSTM